jgi:hypothetical protein
MPIEGWKIHRRIGMSGGLFTRAVAREVGRPLTSDEAEGIQRRHGELYREAASRTASAPGCGRAALGAARRRRSARDCDLGPAPGDRRLTGSARSRRRDGRHRTWRRRSGEAGARSLLRLQRADRRPAGRVLRRRGRGVGPPRRAPRPHAQRRPAERWLRRGRAHARWCVPRLSGRRGATRVAGRARSPAVTDVSSTKRTMGIEPTTFGLGSLDGRTGDYRRIPSGGLISPFPSFLLSPCTASFRTIPAAPGRSADCFVGRSPPKRLVAAGDHAQRTS